MTLRLLTPYHDCSLRALAFRREWIISVAILTRNLPILIVNDQFSILVSTYFPGSINGILLGIKVPR